MRQKLVRCFSLSTRVVQILNAGALPNFIQFYAVLDRLLGLDE